MAELSSRSGTSIPSIKFYLREGLLPSGEATGRNQAEYGEAHLHRLRLIRALIDVGGVSVAGAREVLAAVDTPDLPGHHLLGAASYSLSRTSRRNTDDPIWQEARTEIAALIRQRGWLVDDAAPFIDHAADAVAALRALGQEDMLAMMPTYLEAVERIAGQEVDLVSSPARFWARRCSTRCGGWPSRTRPPGGCSRRRRSRPIPTRRHTAARINPCAIQSIVALSSFR